MNNDEITCRLERMEKKIDEISNLLNLSKKQRKENMEKNVSSDENIIQPLYEYYKKRINKRSRLIDKAKKKIFARLKEYAPEELRAAIDNFSQDAWWMHNNAHRGLAWFFHSEERIEQFINLKPKKAKRNLVLYHDNQQCRWFDNKLKIFADWSGTWLDWNKNYPQYEKFILKENNGKIAEGRKAYDTYINFMKDIKNEEFKDNTISK